MAERLRIVFAGTPEFASVHLQGLLDAAEHEVIAVYSQPDRPAGRGKKLKPSPVKALALEHGIPVYQPVNFKDPADQQQLADLQPDVMVVVAYGLLLPKVILETPRLGCINVHGSLLPRWRGAAPIQRAIEAGDQESGVVIMQMDEGLDTGAMLVTARCDISANETAASLHDKLAELGVPALNQTLQQLASGTAQPVAQDDSHSCYAPKISKAEAAIDWRQSATEIDRRIRAFNPFPIATAQLDGQTIKLWRTVVVRESGEPGTILHADKKSVLVACGEQSLAIEQMQLPGGKVLDTPAVINSKADWFTPGKRFALPDSDT